VQEKTDLKARALRLLANREHSRAELRDKLGRQTDAAALNAVLDQLVELGLQSDTRFAEAFVRTKAERFGANRLRHELARRGVSREVIDAALAQLDPGDAMGDELGRARQVWEKKFGKLPCDAKEWARQARFLQARGFASGIIRQVLKEALDESIEGYES